MPPNPELDLGVGPPEGKGGEVKEVMVRREGKGEREEREGRAGGERGRTRGHFAGRSI